MLACRSSSGVSQRKFLGLCRAEGFGRKKPFQTYTRNPKRTTSYTKDFPAFEAHSTRNGTALKGRGIRNIRRRIDKRSTSGFLGFYWHYMRTVTSLYSLSFFFQLLRRCSDMDRTSSSTDSSTTKRVSCCQRKNSLEEFYRGYRPGEALKSDSCLSVFQEQINHQLTHANRKSG